MTLFSQVDIHDILENLPRFAEDDHLACFGPLDEKAVRENTVLLQERGLVFGTHFITYHHSMPDWCWVKIAAVGDDEE